METDELYQKKFESGTAGVLLYNDRIEISTHPIGAVTIIYFDEVIQVGFLNMDITSRYSTTDPYSFYNEAQEQDLIILTQSSREVLTPYQCGGLQEVCTFIQEKLAAGNFPERKRTVPKSESFEGEYQQMKFETSKVPFTACAGGSALLIILIIISVIAHIAILYIFFAICLFASAYLAYSFYIDYTRVDLYSDKFCVIDFSGRAVNEIYFRDVKTVGFLHGPMLVNRNLDGSVGSGSYGRSDILIILLYTGQRIEISQDISNAHQLAAVIQQNIS